MLRLTHPIPGDRPCWNPTSIEHLESDGTLIVGTVDRGRAPRGDLRLGARGARRRRRTPGPVPGPRAGGPHPGEPRGHRPGGRHRDRRGDPASRPRSRAGSSRASRPPPPTTRRFATPVRRGDAPDPRDRRHPRWRSSSASGPAGWSRDDDGRGGLRPDPRAGGRAPDSPRPRSRTMSPDATAARAAATSPCASRAPSRRRSRPRRPTARPTSPTCRRSTSSTTTTSRSPTSSSPRPTATSPRTRTPACSSSIPDTYDQYRLLLRFERSERRGRLFDAARPRHRGDRRAHRDAGRVQAARRSTSTASSRSSPSPG